MIVKTILKRHPDDTKNVLYLKCGSDGCRLPKELIQDFGHKYVPNIGGNDIENKKNIVLNLYIEQQVVIAPVEPTIGDK